MKKVTPETRLATIEWSTRARGALWSDRSSYERCSHGYGWLGAHCAVIEHVNDRTVTRLFECFDVRRVERASFAPVDVIACRLGKKPDDVTLRDLSEHVTSRDLLDRSQVGAGTVKEIAAVLTSAGLAFKGATHRCPYCKRIVPNAASQNSLVSRANNGQFEEEAERP